MHLTTKCNLLYFTQVHIIIKKRDNCIFYALSDRILNESQSLFIYNGSMGRKKRQIDGPQSECTSFDNCGNQSFVGVRFEDLTFTEEQMVMCNNDEACLYDLVVTGDEAFAAETLRSREEDRRVQEIISKNREPGLERAGDYKYF